MHESWFPFFKARNTLFVEYGSGKINKKKGVEDKDEKEMGFAIDEELGATYTVQKGRELIGEYSFTEKKLTS